MTADNTPTLVIQRTCPQCKQRFKVHYNRSRMSWTEQTIHRFDCPYCAEPLREQLPGQLVRIERLATRR